MESLGPQATGKEERRVSSSLTMAQRESGCQPYPLSDRPRPVDVVDSEPTSVGAMTGMLSPVHAPRSEATLAGMLSPDHAPRSEATSSAEPPPTLFESLSLLASASNLAPAPAPTNWANAE